MYTWTDSPILATIFSEETFFLSIAKYIGCLSLTNYIWRLTLEHLIWIISLILLVKEIQPLLEEEGLKGILRFIILPAKTLQTYLYRVVFDFYLILWFAIVYILVWFLTKYQRQKEIQPIYFCVWLPFSLLTNWGPDQLGSCLILIRQLPDFD